MSLNRFLKVLFSKNIPFAFSHYITARNRARSVLNSRGRHACNPRVWFCQSPVTHWFWSGVITRLYFCRPQQESSSWRLWTSLDTSEEQFAGGHFDASIPDTLSSLEVLSSYSLQYYIIDYLQPRNFVLRILVGYCNILNMAAHVRITTANSIKQQYNRRRASAPVKAHHVIVKVVLL